MEQERNVGIRELRLKLIETINRALQKKKGRQFLLLTAKRRVSPFSIVQRLLVEAVYIHRAVIRFLSCVHQLKMIHHHIRSAQKISKFHPNLKGDHKVCLRAKVEARSLSRCSL
jgi:hypothetical protein